MATITKEEREIRARYPYLSDVGVRGAMKPAEFTVEWDDDELVAKERERVGPDGDLEFGNIAQRKDAKTLAAARRIGRAVLKEQPLSNPRIYRLVGIEREEDRYNGYTIPSWHWEDQEWVEDVNG